MRYGIVAVVLVLAASLATYSLWSQPAPNKHERPLVVCTTTMIADLAHQIGGDRIEVLGIMKPRTDPHIYDPTPDDAIYLKKADLVLYNGLHLEGNMVHIIENAGSKAVALAEDPRIKPRESAQAKGAPDPHCWWNAQYFMIFAEKARDALIHADPSGADDYRSRCETYLEKLAKADAAVRAAIQRIPQPQRYLITSHDAFFYYGEAYGLHVNAVLGISTDASVQALRVNELAELVIEHQVPAIFHETSVSAALNQMIDRVTEICQKQGCPVRVPSEALYSDSVDEPGSPAGTYIGALLANTRIIVSSLSGSEIGDLEATNDRTGARP